MHAYLEKPELPHIETASDNPQGILLTESKDFGDYDRNAAADVLLVKRMEYADIYWNSFRREPIVDAPRMNSHVIEHLELGGTKRVIQQLLRVRIIS